MSTIIQEGSLVLFQGDSITDAGRNREDGADLGQGYAMIAAAWFSALYPEKRVTFLNRGIGGNRVRDLGDRWEADCIGLHPTWVSIMVGINETWRRFDMGDPTPVQDFEACYRAILNQVRINLGARLIIMEPYLLPVGGARVHWREDLESRIEVVRKLAREFEAILIPLDGIFFRAGARREPVFWALDGVHPTPAGHALIAQAWLRAVEAIP